MASAQGRGTSSGGRCSPPVECEEMPMSRVLAMTMAAILATCTTAHAQSASGTAGIGRTSPLGILGAFGGATGTGVPLGATEIDPGGLSPLPGIACDAAASGMTSTGASTFDGGGLTGSASPTAGTGCTAGSTISPNGTASPLSGAATTSTLGTAIPLGATEIDNAGIRPLITTPRPTPALPAPAP